VKNANKGRAKATSGKTNGDQVSELTTNRLSVYLRCLNTLEEAGVLAISSQALAEQFHLNAAQIRKDLAYFGQFGHPGIGYRVADLIQQIRKILGTDKTWNVVLVGAGNLGRALADYPGFRLEGFSIVALFDNDPDRIGRQSRQSEHPPDTVDQPATQCREQRADNKWAEMPTEEQNTQGLVEGQADWIKRQHAPRQLAVFGYGRVAEWGEDVGEGLVHAEGLHFSDGDYDTTLQE